MREDKAVMFRACYHERGRGHYVQSMLSLERTGPLCSKHGIMREDGAVTFKACYHDRGRAVMFRACYNERGLGRYVQSMLS